MTNRILYVEDDQFLREWVTYELSAEGYTVDVAVDGKTGLESAAGLKRPDIIVLDVGLPHMDGFQLCRALQLESSTADIPVIFLSARQTIDDKLQGFDAGGLDYLPKPFAMAELKARIQSGLRRQHMGRIQERKITSSELSEASTLQLNLMQRTVPTFEGLEMAADCRPARHVAGDWFDFQSMDDETLCLLEADVSGKGMPAALVMSETRVSLQQACQSGKRPGAALSAANQQLYDDLTTAGKFVTTFLGSYDATLQQLHYASAAHAAVLCSTSDSAPRLLEPDDPPIGVIEDYAFSERTTAFGPGALLVICSDGITEAVNLAGEMYGHDRLLKTIARHSTLPASALIEILLQDVDTFSAGTVQADDQTLVVIKGA